MRKIRSAAKGGKAKTARDAPSRKGIAAIARALHPLGAHEDLYTAMRTAQAVVDEQRVRETWQPIHGEEPWLERAKALYRTMGQFLSVVSAREGVSAPHAPIVGHAADELRRIVDATESASLRREPARLEALRFLLVVDAAAGKKGPVAGLTDPMSRAALGLASAIDRKFYKAVVTHAELPLLLERWADTTSRRPSKWDLVARIWNDAGGRMPNGKPWDKSDAKKLWSDHHRR